MKSLWIETAFQRWMVAGDPGQQPCRRAKPDERCCRAQAGLARAIPPLIDIGRDRMPQHGATLPNLFAPVV